MPCAHRRLALAQALANTLSPDQLHGTLDRYARQYCPVSDVFGQSCQVECATDLAFRSAAATTDAGVTPRSSRLAHWPRNRRPNGARLPGHQLGACGVILHSVRGSTEIEPVLPGLTGSG
jgi:hypothetical protein